MSRSSHEDISAATAALLALPEAAAVADYTGGWSPETWHAARLAAQVHGIAPLLHSRLGQSGALRIPPPFLSAYVAGQYLLNRTRIQRLDALLRTVLNASGARGIRVMPMKGAVLIHDYYTDPAVRPMADLDLLIHAHDQDAMHDVLEAEGCPLRMATPQHRIYASSDSIASMDGEHPDNPVAIEVHTRARCGIGARDHDLTALCWEGATPGYLGVNEVHAPAPSTLFLHIACHAAYHQYRGSLRAIQLHDLCLVGARLDHAAWEAVSRMAEEAGVAAPVYASLVAARRFLRMTVPEPVMERLERRTPAGLRRRLHSETLDAFSSAGESCLLRLQHAGDPRRLDRVRVKVYQCLAIGPYLWPMQAAWHPFGKEKFGAILGFLRPGRDYLAERGHARAWAAHALLLLLTPPSLLAGRVRLRRALVPLSRPEADMLRRETYPVLGVPVTVASTSDAVSRLAESVFGPWREAARGMVRPDAESTVTVRERPLGPPAADDMPAYEADKDRIVAVGPGAVFAADRRRGVAEALVDPRVIEERADHFRREILECMVLFLATARDRVPLHACALVRNNRALILCGASGAGKTTLSYMLYRRGAALLAEEAVYVSLEGGGRLWGNPRGFSFAPDGRRFFPELSGCPLIRRPNGKQKIQMDLSASGSPDRLCRTFRGPMVMVLLERDGDGPCRAMPMPHGQLVEKLGAHRDPGFDLAADFHRTLLNLPVAADFVFQAGPDPHRAADLLESIAWGGER